MASLLERAEQLRKLISDREEIDAIPEDERQKIYKEIDYAVAISKPRMREDRFRFKAIKNDLKIPVLINLGTLLILSVISTVLFGYFKRAETVLIRDHKEIETAESRLIATLRQESEEQISAKDREIMQIQARLEEMHDRQEKLLSESEDKLTRLERELKENYDAELAAERERLVNLGYRDKALDEKLSEYIARKELEYNEQLQGIRSRLEREVLEQKETMTALIDEYKSSLSRAEADRLQLEEALSQQQAEQQSELIGERDSAYRELEQIQADKERERFVLSSINGMYGEIDESLKDRGYDKAKEQLTELENFLNDESVYSIGAVQFRREIDVFMIQSIRRLIEKEEAEIDTEKLSASAAILSDVNKALFDGNSYYDAGDYAAAQEAYQQAIGKIPALDSGISNLKSMDEQELLEERRNFLLSLEEANSHYKSARYDSAVQQYRKALEYLEGDSDVVEDVVSGLMDSGAAMEIRGKALVSETDLKRIEEARVLQESRQAVVDGLIELENRYDGSPEAVSDTGDLMSYLNTKLLIMEVLASDSIKEDYPDLHDKMGDYLQAYGLKKEQEGRKAALQEIISITEYLGGQQENLSRPEADEAQLFMNFLENLRGILESES